jgi:DNA primase
VGVQNRNLVKGATPRFRFPQGAQCGIYNLPVLNLLKPGEQLFITEGCNDCWAMLSAGHKAIAIPSATLLKRKDAEQLSILISQFSIRFAMYPDNDVPGERLFLQLQEVLPSLVRYQLPQGCKDFSDYYLTTQKFLKNN